MLIRGVTRYSRVGAAGATEDRLHAREGRWRDGRGCCLRFSEDPVRGGTTRVADGGRGE